MTIDEINELIDQLSDRQTDRLMRSDMRIDEFLRQREEQQVTDEINQLHKMLDELESQAA